MFKSILITQLTKFSFDGDLKTMRHLESYMIQNQLRFEEKQKAQRTDKKLQQKINDKKQAQGLKM